MSHYSIGRAIEVKIVNFLKEHGYNATRSAGSKGAFDVIAYNSEMVRFIQAKFTSSDKQNYSQDFRKMTEVGLPSCATKELWVYRKNVGFIEVHFLSKPKRVVIPEKVSIILHEQ